MLLEKHFSKVVFCPITSRKIVTDYYTDRKSSPFRKNMVKQPMLLLSSSTATAAAASAAESLPAPPEKKSESR